jgi:putative ATP-dependent endonuclease of the OLD family
MRIEHLCVSNYRTLVDCAIDFPDYYSAISGKNNAGKSNLLNAMRAFFVDDDTYDPFGSEVASISHKLDYPLWKRRDETKATIAFAVRIRIHRRRDEGMFKFVQTFLAFTCNEEDLVLEFRLEFHENSVTPTYALSCQGKDVEDEFKVQEIHKKLKTSNALVFYNSTKPRHLYYVDHRAMSFLGQSTTEDREKINEAKNALFRRLNAVAAKHKAEIADMLGRLDERYEVGISIPNFDFENFPFRLSLGDKKDSVPLDDWGSGTQNRTHILLALLRAKKFREAGTESNRITPIIIVEEPESFLHPSAQAEFGKLLRDLSREFEVQVISTTHSPHMLSVERPDANILLTRRTERGKALETRVEDTTGKDWMRPFALALGVTSDSFGPWRSILFAEADELLLVEGDIDKDYFEKLRGLEHGDNRLLIEGVIFSYGGDGFFAHDVMLKFVLERFPRVVITFDLDVESRVVKKLESLGLKRDEDFCSIGLKSPGKKNIEGLLPSKITSDVAASHPDIVDLASSTDEGNKDAKQKLKRLKYEVFFRNYLPLSDAYSELYKVTDAINKAFKRKRK